jgi:type IV secretory pathway VirB9-like protein
MKQQTIYFLAGAIFAASLTSVGLAYASGVLGTSSSHIVPTPPIAYPIAAPPVPQTASLPVPFKTLENSLLRSNNSTDSSHSTDSSVPDVQQCQVIHWVSNRVYTVKGSMNMGTHMVFPETAIDSVVGNKDLWTKEGTLNHVFVKPNSKEPDGNLSTLTFVGKSNTSYEFILKRVPDAQDVPCVIVLRDGDMLNKTAWNNYQDRDKQIIQLMSAQFQQQKNQIIAQQQNALDKYRGMIYTGYTWQSRGWFGRNLISDVYDDGRWTYIRVNDDNKGIMAIYGMLDGKKNVLQFSYDETNKMYRVAGIYPTLKLAYGKNTLVITRKSA